MRPEPVKKREMFWPLSASWAICSAVAALCVLLIQSPLLTGRFPQRYQVVELTLFVFANLEDQRVKHCPHPSDCSKLLGKIRALVQIIGPGEYFLSFLEADPAFGILQIGRASGRERV